MRATCAPHVSRVARVLVRVICNDGDGRSPLTAHIVIVAGSSALFGAGAAWMGVGGSELCKLAGALVVSGLAVSAASLLVKRQLGAYPREWRSLLASTVRLVLPAHAGVPAARVLQLVFDPPRTLAALSTGVTRAAIALPLQHGQAAIVRRVVRSVPMLTLALDAHETYRDVQQSVRFVRHFALTAAALCPEPAEAYALPFVRHALLPAPVEPASLCA